jgi:hypothetical protein
MRLCLQRAFYFNMALGRSFWEVPDDIKAQVQQPLVDELRRWDPQAMDAKYGANPAQQEELKRRREEAIASAKSRADEQEVSSGPTLTLQERMALAAQRKREEEIAARKAAGQEIGDKPGDTGAQSNEYLAMVRQLEHVDRDTDTSGGKWLVR